MKNKSGLSLVILLAVAAIITFVVGETRVNWIKLGGVVLAIVVFLPVFLMLRRTIGGGSTTRFLVIFVGGFFLKLVIVIVVIWYVIADLRLPEVDFVVGCLAFLMALQIYEAIYFWEKGGALTGSDSN